MVEVAPADLLVKVNLTSTLATVSFSRDAAISLRVVAPDGVRIDQSVGADGLSFSTPADGIYLLHTLETDGDHVYCIPILGHLLACRWHLAEKAAPCTCCTELDKALRTLDVLIRSIYALAGMGDNEQASLLLALAIPLCCDCDC